MRILWINIVLFIYHIKKIIIYSNLMNINYYIIVGLLILITLKIISRKNIKENLISLKDVKDLDGEVEIQTSVQACMEQAQDRNFSGSAAHIGQHIRKLLSGELGSGGAKTMKQLLGSSDNENDTRSGIGQSISNYTSGETYPNNYATYVDERSRIGINAYLDYNDSEKQDILDSMAIPVLLPNVKCKAGQSGDDCELELDEPTNIKLYYKNKKFSNFDVNSDKNYCSNIVKCHCRDSDGSNCVADICSFKIINE